jgi:DNA polymerase
MKVLTIDFETYYDNKFSLSKLTTEEYVRDEQFEVIGVSVQVDTDEPQWFSGTHAQIKDFLGQYNFEKNLALAHNAMFDAAILGWSFGINPRGWLDTLSMARALHGTEVGGSLKTLAEYYDIGVKGDEVIAAQGKRKADFTDVELARYGEYCKNDTALTYKLFQCMSDGFPKVELRLIDLTIKMFSEPVLHLNPGILEEHLTFVRGVKDKLMDKLQEAGYTREDLMSNPKLAEIFTTLSVIPPTKISAATGKETWAFSKTDEEFKALLEHEDEYVQAIVAARLGVKSTLEETRTERFIAIAQRGPMPVPLRYYAAHTGRWGGDDKLNLQNLPRNSPLKSAIVAPVGYVILDADSAQIEARIVAWLAGQEDLLTAFTNGEDVYKIMASSIYMKPVEEVNKAERFVGKTTILGAGYGMGATKFQTQLKNFGVDTPLEECKRIIDVYRKTYPKIPELWRDAHDALTDMMSNKVSDLGRNGLLKIEGKNGIRLPNDLYIKYPNIRKVQQEDGKSELLYDTKKGRSFIPTRIYGGKVVENLCQALARIVIGGQMLMIAKKYRVVMTVHDAVACIVPEGEAELAKEYVELCMRLRPEWAQDLPLNCESGYGHSYGEC